METVIIGKAPWSVKSSSEDPYQELAEAIVYQAVKDLVRTLQKLWRPNVTEKQKQKLVLTVVEIEDFVYSGWYEWLTDIDPDKLLVQCRIVAKEKEKKFREKQNRKAIKKKMMNNYTFYA